EPFIVYSGDILTDVALEPLITEHFRAGNDVTLGLRRNTGLGAGVVVRDGRIVEISTKFNPKENFDYANISVWNPEIFARIPAGKSAHVDPTAQVRGCSVVGPDCCVGAEAVLENTILWRASEIASKSQLHGCIVRSQKRVSGIHRNSDI